MFTKKLLAGLTVPLAVGSLALSAMPAQALTKSGSISCVSGAKIGIHGTQQTLATMTLKANSSIVWRGATTYEKWVTSGATSGTWSADSPSLLLSGSSGYCAPIAG